MRLRRTLGLLAPQRGRILLAVAAGSAAALCTVGLMAASGLLISRAALRPVALDLAALIGVVRLLAIGRGCFRYLERLASHDAALRSLGDLRVWFFRRLEPLAPGGLGGERTGDLLARFAGDVDSLQSFVVRGVVPLAVAGVTAVAGVALAGFLLPAGGAIVAVLALSAGAAAPWLAVRLESGEERRLAEARGDLAAEVADLLDGAQEIVAFGRQDEWLGRLDRAEAALTSAERQAAWRSGIREGLGALIWALAPLAVLVAGIPAVRAGRLPGVDLAALVLLAWATLEVLRGVPAAVDSIRAGLSTAGRLFEVADRIPPVADPVAPLAPPGAGPIDVEDLRVRHRPDRPPALDGLSLSIRPGAIVAVVGPSGAGKTTLAQALVRFCGIESGGVVMDGHDVAAYAQDGVRSLVGLLAQDAYVFHTSIGANVRLARPEATDGEVAEACRRAGLSRWLETLPEGLDTPAGNDGALVSGGERQRIALARALLAGRRVLILDEPTANLDPETGRRVIDEFLDAAGGTIVLITHDLAAAARADEVVLVDGGRSVEHGSPAELLAAGGRYARMRGMDPGGA